MTNPDYTHFMILADRTGSMGLPSDGFGSATKAELTTSGIKTLIADQATAPGRTTFSLAEFDSHGVTHVADFVPGDSKEISSWRIVPRGGTPLLDALGAEIVLTGEALAKLPENERPGRVYFVVGTDGEENESKEYTKAQIAEMVKTQTETYKWEFVFIGADIDAFDEAGGMGFSKGSTLNTVGSAMAMAYESTSSAITRSRMRGGPVSYSESERSAAAGPRIPTLAELTSTWKQNRADDAAAADDATWD